MSGRRGSTRPLLALGLAEVLALAAIGWIPGARETPFPAVALWVMAFGAYAAAALILPRASLSRGVVWGVGLAGRALLLPLAPHFSEDVYRYLWDGRVQLAGINPYLHAPADPALSELRTAWHALVNHPEVPTIYPPAAQVAFLLIAAAGSSLLLLKLAWLACDLGTAWIVERMARSRDARGPDGRRQDAPSSRAPTRNPAAATRALLLYLWCPLLVLEVAWSGHLEPLGLLPTMAALLFLGGAAGGWAGAGGRAGRNARAPDGPGRRERRRGLLAGLLLGLGAAVKLAPAAGLPALARRRGPAAALAGLAAFLILALPYLPAGERLLTGLDAYVDRWEFNPGGWWLLAELVGDRSARNLGVIGTAAVALLAAARRWPVERVLFWTIGTALLLSPTLHPWYVLWILPFAALRASLPWLLFTGTVFLAYWGRSAYLATGSWPQPTAVALLIHLPLLLLLALEAAGIRAPWPRSRPRRGR